MEDRECRDIKLDLLKTTVADACARKVGVQSRTDRPWQALVHALRFAIDERLRNDAHLETALMRGSGRLFRPEEITESEVRRRVVQTYLQQEKSFSHIGKVTYEGIDAVMEQKLKDPFSFFNQAGYGSVAEVKDHWAWYLCCLAHEDRHFEDLTPLRHLEGHVDGARGPYDLEIKPKIRSEFSVAFQLRCQVCFPSYNSSAGALVFEGTYQGHPVMQLVFGEGQYQGCLVAKFQTTSGYSRNGRKEPVLTRELGFISRGGDILKQTMTIEAAKRKAATLPNCRGFSFEGPDHGQPLEVFFKDKFEIKVEAFDPNDKRFCFPGEWISYRVDDNVLQEWLVSAPLSPGEWQDVMLIKGPKYLKLSVQGAESSWKAKEDADPFYSEMSSCDCLSIGGGKDKRNTIYSRSGWLAEVKVGVGEAGQPPPNMARMPLDQVDLQAVATAFGVQITVNHLMDSTWCFSPSGDIVPDCCARLGRHQQLWFAILGLRPLEEEPLPLAGAVVELGNLPGLLQPANRRAASVLGHLEEHDAYRVCVGQVTFPIRRSQINRIVYQEDGGSHNLSDLHAEDEGPEVLKYIPTKSLQFYLLLELVKKFAADRLQSTHLQVKGVLPVDGGRTISRAPRASTPVVSHSVSRRALSDLPPNEVQPVQLQAEGSSEGSGSSIQVGEQGFKPAGKDEVPTRKSAQTSSHQSHAAAASQSPQVAHAGHYSTAASASSASRPITTASVSSGPSPITAASISSAPSSIMRMPLQHVKTMLQRQSIKVSVVCAWKPFARGQLQVKASDSVFVKEFREHWALCHFALHEAAQGWCPIICLSLWKMHTPFAPDPRWGAALRDHCLRLEVNDDVVLTKIFEDEWSGWAEGRVHSPTEDEGRQGIFCLQHAEQEVFVVR